MSLANIGYYVIAFILIFLIGAKLYEVVTGKPFVFGKKAETAPAVAVEKKDEQPK